MGVGRDTGGRGLGKVGEGRVREGVGEGVGTGRGWERVGSRDR